jgi:hypothetical protein
MKAVLVTGDREKIVDRSAVDLPDNYDGDPYGDTVPFCVGSNQYLEIIDELGGNDEN